MVTAVERHTRCVVGWQVLWQREQGSFQALIDTSPKARNYFSDEFPLYGTLVYYPGKLTVSEGKSDTYTVEGVNADLRHYLARLVRRSRCFSRCPQALENAIKLLVYCYNSRQLYKHKYPNYSTHVIDFVST
ncbi:MAG: IS1 family transposase [Anaerolineae bacterium]|nr:MAG: IS1 family transposase [Anaerolineae bacterium]